MKDYMYIGFPKIKKFLLLYSVPIVIFISIAIIFFTIYPLSNKILKFEQTRLNSIIRDKKKFIDDYISRNKTVTYNIANQTYFREFFLKYLKNSSSLDIAKNTVNTKIDEIFYLIPEIKGISLFSTNNRPLLKRGILPFKELISIPMNDTILISSPFEIKNHWYISSFAPIKDSNKEYIGSIVLTMDFAPVIDFLKQGFKDSHYMNFALGEVVDKDVRIFFREGNKKYDPFLKKGILQNTKKKIEVISIARGRKYSQEIISAPISGTKWVFVLTIDQTLLLPPIINLLRLFLIAIILFIIFGSIYTYWVFVKIIKGSIQRARELEGEVSAKSLQLAEEIQKRENLEELYEINMNFLTVVLDTVPIPISARDAERGEYVFVN